MPPKDVYCGRKEWVLCAVSDERVQCACIFIHQWARSTSYPYRHFIYPLAMSHVCVCNERALAVFIFLHFCICSRTKCAIKINAARGNTAQSAKVDVCWCATQQIEMWIDSLAFENAIKRFQSNGKQMIIMMHAPQSHPHFYHLFLSFSSLQLSHLTGRAHNLPFQTNGIGNALAHGRKYLPTK